jgi:hypothetical protein
MQSDCQSARYTLVRHAPSSLDRVGSGLVVKGRCHSDLIRRDPPGIGHNHVAIQYFTTRPDPTVFEYLTQSVRVASGRIAVYKIVGGSRRSAVDRCSHAIRQRATGVKFVLRIYWLLICRKLLKLGHSRRLSIGWKLVTM